MGFLNILLCGGILDYILMVYYFKVKGLQLGNKSMLNINHYGLAKSKINVCVVQTISFGHWPNH